MADAFVAIQPPLDVYRNRCEPTTRLDGLDEAGVVQVPVTEVEADDAVRRKLGLAQCVPVDVLTELGRVTWAAIMLEEYTESLCFLIGPPANPRTDRRQVSEKIRDAKRVAAGWPDPSPREEITASLERARRALERRNAALHATPLVWIQRGRPREFVLGEMPRKGTPYKERALTVESLAELRTVLEAARAGWVELALAVGEYQQQSKVQPDT